MTRSLGDATWPEVATTELVLVPVGSIEQHGPHLPLDTDAVIAAAVTRAVADRLPEALVAPALTYGASGEHQGFAGTSSIGTQTLRLVIVELVRSMRLWAGRLVFINGHGGNFQALTGAIDQLRSEGHDVSWAPCAVKGVDAHAGFAETSLMLHLRPDTVRLPRAEVGNTGAMADLMPALLTDGVKSVSVNGVLGDPTTATAEAGRDLFARMVDDVHDRVWAAVSP